MREVRISRKAQPREGQCVIIHSKVQTRAESNVAARSSKPGGGEGERYREYVKECYEEELKYVYTW